MTDPLVKAMADYADLTARIGELTDKRDALKEVITTMMSEQKIGTYPHDRGTFTLAHRSRWEYTKEVEMMEEMLDMRKEDERERGLAKEVAIETLQYRAK